ncbi:MAG: transposase family protein [Alphaproteobacteria bacterium]|nr:transposase family protein [Alphaproteobacteria bacterium]MBU1560029.1 transposase family protein [Alphaproteobacteria bacterium]MBU2302331.1 transposase family protein [Alphaproteobacteria bacterium]MBU2369395.1 transposase family protein [Alphaproteobacteria bacterium]
MTFNGMNLPKIDFDLEKGDVYWIKEGPDNRWAVRFERMDMRGLLVFLRDDGPDLTIAVDLFKRMRSDGRAIRVPEKLRTRKSPLELGDVDPTNLLDPQEPGIDVNEQSRRLKKFEIFQRAKDLRWFVVEADEKPLLTRGHAGIQDFIQSKEAEARRYGATFIPSAPTLLRAIDQCGVFQSRPLSAFFYDYGKHDKLRRWHPVVIRERDKMIQAYWHPDKKPLHEVRNDFWDAILTEIKDFKSKGLPVPRSLRKPSKECVRVWINMTEDWYRYKERYGQLSADGHFRGRGKHIEATRPLEYVCFDHTVVDCWALVEDEDGNVLIVEKPTLTLAVDVFTRMRLGAVLTYEPPSIYTVNLCLKQVIRFKDFLVDEFGELKGACDGWGKPKCIIVDNGWEFVGMSFQATCEAAGISVIWAPVRTPQFKAVVEQAFDDLNEHVWHRLPGGITLTPQLRAKLRIDNRAKTAHTIRQLEYLMWHHIVHVRHREPNEDIGCAPALKWVKGIDCKSRATVDDPSLFDGLLGQGERCVLTPQGVAVNGQRFHDQAITSQLLDRLLRYGRKKHVKGSFYKAGNVDVYVTRDRVDASYVMVWDFDRRKSVRLPNVKSRFAQGTSWKVLEAVEAFATAENLAFHDEDAMIAARAHYNRMIRSQIPIEGFGKARKRAAEIDRAPSLVPGDRVVERFVPATPDGSGDVPHDTAAIHRSDDRVPTVGPNRGKRKSGKTRGGARPTAANSKNGPATTPAASPPPAQDYALADPLAFLRQLENADQE